MTQFVKQGHFADRKPRVLNVNAGPWPFVICMAILLVWTVVTTRAFFYYPLQCLVLVGTYAFVRFNARRLNWDYGPSR